MKTGEARPKALLPAAVCGWNISAPNRNAKQAPVSAGAANIKLILFSKTIQFF